MLSGWTADGLWYEVWETESGVVVRLKDEENRIVELYKILESVFVPLLVKDLEEEGSWIIKGMKAKEKVSYPAGAVRMKIKPAKFKAKLIMRKALRSYSL